MKQWMNEWMNGWQQTNKQTNKWTKKPTICSLEVLLGIRSDSSTQWLIQFLWWIEMENELWMTFQLFLVAEIWWFAAGSLFPEGVLLFWLVFPRVLQNLIQFVQQRTFDSFSLMNSDGKWSLNDLRTPFGCWEIKQLVLNLFCLLFFQPPDVLFLITNSDKNTNSMQTMWVRLKRW